MSMIQMMQYMMGYFVLGTLPMLLLIGLSSVKLLEKPHISQTFSKVAGFLLLFFALFNISTQMNVLGFNVGIVSAFNGNQVVSNNRESLAPMVDGKQVILMTIYAVRYDPNYFKIKAGIPVRWEITVSGQIGCASGALVANGLLNAPVYLNPQQGQVTVAEFTPQKPGKYKFSCTMNMVRGTIEVVS